MSNQSSNKTRSTLEDAIVEYANAVAIDENEFSQHSSAHREDSWEAMLNAIDEHEEMMYREAYKDGRDENVKHQLDELKDA